MSFMPAHRSGNPALFAGSAPPAPTIAFRALTSTSYAARADTVLSPPAGLANGDILVATILIVRGSDDIDEYDPVPPDGFSAFGTATKVNDSTGVYGKLHVFWKRASGESGDYTFTHLSTSSQGVLKAYSGCRASGTPLGATSNNTGLSPAASGTGITTTAANSRLLYEAHDWTGSGALTPPAGMSERFDSVVYCADQLIASPGATGDRSQTNGSAPTEPWAVRMIELLAA